MDVSGEPLCMHSRGDPCGIGLKSIIYEAVLVGGGRLGEVVLFLLEEGCGERGWEVT